MKQERSNTLFLVEVAVFSALAFLFDFIAGLLSLKIWPQGGSISIAMVPVFLMAFRWGIKGGILSGFFTWITTDYFWILTNFLSCTRFS